MKKTAIFRFFFFLFIIILISFFGFKKFYRPPMQEQTRLLMDTKWTIKVPGGKQMNPVINKVFDRLQQIDDKFSVMNSGSIINKFNHFGEPITDKEIIGVIQRAKEVGDLTSGNFDITVQPLLEAFGFYSREYKVPSPKEVQELLKHVGYKKFLVISDNKVTKSDPLVAIDLGGIAKSYALNEALKVLQENKVKNALIDGGGDLYALGLYAGKPWRIGIQHPRKDGLLGELSITDMAIYSSGDYERYFIDKGVRYFHIFNPKTGYPAWGLIGSTVIYPKLFQGGGLSSSLVIMGKEKALTFIDALPGAAAILVDEKSNVFFSKGLQKNLGAKTKFY